MLSEIAADARARSCGDNASPVCRDRLSPTMSQLPEHLVQLRDALNAYEAALVEHPMVYTEQAVERFVKADITLARAIGEAYIKECLPL